MYVTIKDVAKKSNVSPSTVSRVIADNPKISDKTKAKVFAAMKELNYQPNIIARSLANKKSYTLGLIIPSKEEKMFENSFFIQAMRGLSIYAQSKGYYIMYNYCQSEEDELRTIEQFVSSKWVDGIILTTTKIVDKNIDFLFEKDQPFVVIGTPQAHRDQILYVDNDNVAAMENVVNTMIEQGHKKIVFSGGEYQFTVNRHRLRGYKQALASHGIVYDDALVMKDGACEEAAYNEMVRMLESLEPDAIVGTDDGIAHGAYKAYYDTKNKEIAIASFNNTALSIYHKPSMSSVNVNSEELGHRAAELLINKIEKKVASSNKVIIDAKFIQRESTLDFRMD